MFLVLPSVLSLANFLVLDNLPASVIAPLALLLDTFFAPAGRAVRAMLLLVDCFQIVTEIKT